MADDEDSALRDVEIALMDTLKLVFEVMVAKGLSTPETIDAALKRQAQGYPPEHTERAIWVIERIRASVSDPRRKELRDFLARPPQGRA